MLNNHNNVFVLLSYFCKERINIFFPHLSKIFLFFFLQQLLHNFNIAKILFILGDFNAISEWK